MYIVEGNNILLRQAPQACAEIRIGSLTCSCAREFRKSMSAYGLTEDQLDELLAETGGPPA